MIQLEYRCKRCKARFLMNPMNFFHSDFPLTDTMVDTQRQGSNRNSMANWFHSCGNGAVGWAELIGFAPEEVKDGSDAV
jgi:hypothetical protein